MADLSWPHDAITGMSKLQRLQTEWKECRLYKFTHSKDKDFSREWICSHAILILSNHSRELHFILTEIQANCYSQWLIQSWTEIVFLTVFFPFSLPRRTPQFWSNPGSFSPFPWRDASTHSFASWQRFEPVVRKLYPLWSFQQIQE